MKFSTNLFVVAGILLAPLLILLNKALLRILGRIASLSPSVSADFNHYYSTAWLVLNGEIPYGVNFNQLEISSQFQYLPNLAHATNPPVLALLTAPLALFTPFVSWVIWEVVLIASGLGIVVFGCRLFDLKLSISALSLLSICFLSSSQVAYCLTYSQVSLFLVFLLVVATLLSKRENFILAGFVWGLVVSLKLYFWPIAVFILLFCHRQLKVYFTTALILFSFLPILIFGPQIYISFYDNALPIVKSWQYSNHNFNFLFVFSNFINYFFTYNVLGNPVSRVLLVNGFAFGLNLFFVVLLGKLRRPLQERLVLISLSSTLLAPVAWSHYYILLIVPVILILSRLRDNRPLAILFSFIAYLVWFSSPYHPFSHMALDGFWWVWYYCFNPLICVTLIFIILFFNSRKDDLILEVPN